MSATRDTNEPSHSHEAHEPPQKHDAHKKHDVHDLGFELPKPAKASPARVLLFGTIILGVIIAGFLVAWLPKRNAHRALEAGAKESQSTLLRVTVVTPAVRTSDRVVLLPGSVQPLEETVVYARASGYVNKWLVDIGDKVKEGDTLVEVDTPEIDQQLSEARAQLVQAQAALGQATANRDFSKTSLARYKDLVAQGLAAQQDLDQKAAQAAVDAASVKVAEAAIQAQMANVRRLSETKSWGNVKAPFGGTVNARMVERGALVSPTTQLFRLSAVDPVRVFVQVPQDLAPSVRVDVPAKVTVREYAGRIFDGKVARSAGALDAETRTMKTEVRVPNPDGVLFAGMYAQVGLTLPSPHKVLEIPATAVMNDAKGLRVAIVGPDNKIKLVPVVVERDAGATFEIASGLQETDRVVTLGSTELVEGRTVEIAK